MLGVGVGDGVGVGVGDGVGDGVGVGVGVGVGDGEVSALGLITRNAKGDRLVTWKETELLSIRYVPRSSQALFAK